MVAEIVASPGAAVFGKGRREVKIQLAAAGDVPFRVLEIDHADDPLEAIVNQEMTGSRQEVTLSLNAAARPLTNKGRVRVVTDHPLQPVVFIPYFITAAARPADRE